MRDELRDGGDASLAWTLLFGLASGEPGTGEELGDAVGGPVGGDHLEHRLLAEVLRQLRAEGHAVSSDGVAHLAPTVYGHINRYGKYRFDVPLETGQLRPLRQPSAGP